MVGILGLCFFVVGSVWAQTEEGLEVSERTQELKAKAEFQEAWPGGYREFFFLEGNKEAYINPDPEVGGIM